jgi:outer membrane protein assembly factor BamB
LQSLEAALQQRPDDADLLAEYGSALIADNRPAEAFEHLLRSLQLRPSNAARVLLVDAIGQGLRNDFTGFSKLVPRARPLLEKTDQFQTAWAAWAAALREHGESKAALEANLAAAAAEVRPGELMPAESLRRVRRDRFWAAQLADSYAAAASAQRDALDELIAVQLRNPQMLAFLGWHRAADAQRLQQAGQLAAKQPLRAELLLRQVLSSGQPEQQRAAAAMLASLLCDGGDALEAAKVYRFLQARWPDEVCLDGKTGRELASMLPADDSVRKLINAPPMWPKGKVYIEAIAGGRPASGTQEVWVTVVPLDDSPGRPVSHAIVTTSMSMVLVDSHGRQRARIHIERGSGTVYSPLVYPMYSQVYTLGRLVVAFAGDRVHVVQISNDAPEGARTLWSRPVLTEQSAGLGMIWAAGRGSRFFAMPASAGLPVAVSFEAVCLLGDRKVTALDPVTGEPLWVRDDMPSTGALFGDGRRLVVAARDSNEAEVLDMLDGRTIARCTVPPADQRMWTLGTQVVTWEAAQQTGTLGLYDPLEGKYRWQRKYESGPKAWPISPQEVAVCDEQGRLEVVALPGGRVLCSAQLDSPSQLRDLIVHKAFGQYVVIVNHRSSAVMSAIGHAMPIEGMAYGIDAASGRLRWSAELSQCGFRPGGPTDIPLLVFELSALVRRGASYQQLTKLMCIDKRTGELLVDRDSTGRTGLLHQVNSDPEGRRIEIVGQNETFRFHFTDEPEHPQQRSSK